MDYDHKKAVVDALNQPGLIKVPNVSENEEGSKEIEGLIEIHFPKDSGLAVNLAECVNCLVDKEHHIADKELEIITAFSNIILNAEQCKQLAEAGVNLPGYPSPARAQGWAQST